MLWILIKREILPNAKINFTFSCTFMFQRQICYTEMINLLLFTINVLKSHRHPQCTLQLLCEVRLLLESAFTCLHAGSSIQNANEQFVSCIHLTLAHFSTHPTPQTKLYLRDNSECDTCSYEFVISESPTKYSPSFLNHIV